MDGNLILTSDFQKLWRTLYLNFLISTSQRELMLRVC